MVKVKVVKVVKEVITTPKLTITLKLITIPKLMITTELKIAMIKMIIPKLIMAPKIDKKKSHQSPGLDQNQDQSHLIPRIQIPREVDCWWTLVTWKITV